MSKKAKEILIALEEMAGLSQVIVVDANCDGLIPEILKISKKTDARDVRPLTGEDSPLDDEIHDALQDVGIEKLVFVTRNNRHFDKPGLRLNARYSLICIPREASFNDKLAADLVFALRHDPDLKGKDIAGRYRTVYLTQPYVTKIRNLKKHPPRRSSKKKK